MTECEVGDVDLANLWNDDESFPRDVQRIRSFDIARENENKLISRSEPVCRVHRPVEIGIKLRQRGAKHFKPKNVEAAVSASKRIGDVGAYHSSTQDAPEAVTRK